MNRDIISSMEVKLPEKNGEPDWEYMEDYMRNTLEMAQKRLYILQSVSE